MLDIKELSTNFINHFLYSNDYVDIKKIGYANNKLYIDYYSYYHTSDYNIESFYEQSCFNIALVFEKIYNEIKNLKYTIQIESNENEWNLLLESSDKKIFSNKLKSIDNLNILIGLNQIYNYMIDNELLMYLNNDINDCDSYLDKYEIDELSI